MHDTAISEYRRWPPSHRSTAHPVGVRLSPIAVQMGGTVELLGYPPAPRGPPRRGTGSELASPLGSWMNISPPPAALPWAPADGAGLSLDLTFPLICDWLSRLDLLHTPLVSASHPLPCIVASPVVCGWGRSVYRPTLDGRLRVYSSRLGCTCRHG